jgi:hypothetical protein
MLALDALPDMLPLGVEPVADPPVDPVAEPVEPVAEPTDVEPVADPVEEPEPDMLFATVPVTSTRLPTRLLSSDVLPVRR